MNSRSSGTKTGPVELLKYARLRALIVAGLAAGTMMTGSLAVAQAADMIAADNPPELTEAQMAGFSWTGYYIGANLNYTGYRDRTIEYMTATGAETGLEYPYKSTGYTAGIMAGADYQLGSLVVGAAGDFDMGRMTGGFVDPPLGEGRDVITWQGSLRGRIGVSMDRILIYGTGGLAMANIKNTYTNLTTGTSESFAKVHYGWTVGAGADIAITDNWIAGVELRHVDFRGFSNESLTAFPGLTGHQDPSSNSIRLNLRYKF